jgi:mannosyl-3-phosphoglycerate phosphatase
VVSLQLAYGSAERFSDSSYSFTRAEAPEIVMKMIVFTDLDGTLLDAQTYSWQPAGEALEALRRRGGSLVLVSSKTLVEMELLHRELHFSDPFIVENGGGIAALQGTREAADLLEVLTDSDPIFRNDYVLFPLSKSYEDLVSALGEIAVETGCSLRGLSAMSDREITGLTGLDAEAVKRARMRDFDEPFLLGDSEPTSVERIISAASDRGLSVVRGGRFWHLIGHSGKGKAVAIVREAYRLRFPEIFSMGLGDSPNDFSFLELMDVSILVGVKTAGSVLPASLRRTMRVAKEGPQGWNEAVLGILSHWPDSWAQA